MGIIVSDFLSWTRHFYIRIWYLALLFISTELSLIVVTSPSKWSRNETAEKRLLGYQCSNKVGWSLSFYGRGDKDDQVTTCPSLCQDTNDAYYVHVSFCIMRQRRQITYIHHLHNVIMMGVSSFDAFWLLRDSYGMEKNN